MENDTALTGVDEVRYLPLCSEDIVPFHDRRHPQSTAHISFRVILVSPWLICGF
jgi:hypothetical protein